MDVCRVTRLASTKPCGADGLVVEGQDAARCGIQKGTAVRDIGRFQNDVRDLLGPDLNFGIDEAHAGKPRHVNLTARLPEIGGADSVEVDENGNVIGGYTQIGPKKLNW